MPWTSRAAAAFLVVERKPVVRGRTDRRRPGTALVGSGDLVSRALPTGSDARIGADGLVESITTPGITRSDSTAYAALGLATARSGRDLALLAANALSTHVDELVVDSGADVPGNLSLLILLNEALGQNPRSYGGQDLVARLMATMQTAGPDAGLFGNQFAVYDGPFRQGLALAALSLVEPRPAELGGAGGVDASLPVTWLLGQQCADGSWMYRPDTLGALRLRPEHLLRPRHQRHGPRTARPEITRRHPDGRPTARSGRVAATGAEQRWRLVAVRRRRHRERPRLDRPRAGRVPSRRRRRPPGPGRDDSTAEPAVRCARRTPTSRVRSSSRRGTPGDPEVAQPAVDLRRRPRARPRHLALVADDRPLGRQPCS